MNAPDEVRLWVAEGGEPLADHAAGAGRCVAIVRKAPVRAHDEPCEDAAALLGWGDSTAVLIVADGVGGQAGGFAASRLVIAQVVERLRQVGADVAALQTAVLGGIEAANQQLLAEGGGATTVLVAIVDRGTLRSYHAGDSELLVVGQRGRIKYQTVSHSPVGYAVEAGVIDAAQGFVHQDRHLISNCVGMSGMRVELTSAIPLAPRDTLVLASDGLWDNLPVNEVAEVVRKGPLDRAVRRLVSTCADRMLGGDATIAGKPDDLSVLLYRAR